MANSISPFGGNSGDRFGPAGNRGTEAFAPVRSPGNEGFGPVRTPPPSPKDGFFSGCAFKVPLVIAFAVAAFVAGKWAANKYIVVPTVNMAAYNHGKQYNSREGELASVGKGEAFVCPGVKLISLWRQRDFDVTEPRKVVITANMGGTLREVGLYYGPESATTPGEGRYEANTTDLKPGKYFLKDPQTGERTWDWQRECPKPAPAP